ncbi:MAG: L-2-amino-thiazoline-4-carboxylic acid hydrolase, partial [Chloroflexota bacterium]
MKTKPLPNLKRWERRLANERGRSEAIIFLTSVQARYDELLSRARRYENRALRGHFEGNILPIVAAYSVLLMDGAEEETAGGVVDLLLEASVESERRMYRFWGRFPIFFNVVRLALKPMMKMQFPADWDIEWLDLGRDLVGFNCRSCFYLDRLTEYGYPELTPHFCRVDEALMSEVARTIRFERTQTLGRGGTMCDFRYAR